MKTKMLKISAAILASTAVAVCALVMRTVDEAPSFEAPERADAEYFVQAYSARKIAVFEADRVRPAMVVEVCVGVLPADDAAMLRSGVRVRGTDGLRSLIEDITS